MGERRVARGFDALELAANCPVLLAFAMQAVEEANRIYKYNA